METLKSIFQPICNKLDILRSITLVKILRLIGLVVLVGLDIFAVYIFVVNWNVLEVIYEKIYKESGIVGVGVGFSSVLITLYITWGQTKQMERLETLNKNIDDHVLGTLVGFDRVLAAILKLLDEANQDKSSTVYFMAYWLWFGADKKFNKKLSKIERHDSDFYLKFSARIVENKPTTYVVYSDPETIKTFVTKLVKYTKKIPRETQLNTEDDNQISQLVQTYKKELDLINELTKGDRSNVLAKFQSEIPVIIFAVDGEVPAGIWYIGETPILDLKSKLGGFMSRQPAMVEMLIDQVKHFAGQVESVNTTPTITTTLRDDI
jgi:hypothetical protein